jgi:hypothetical protein
MVILLSVTGCGNKEETLNILGYDNTNGGLWRIRPYNEVVAAFQIKSKVKVNFEIVTSDDMSYENFLLKAASELNVGKVDLVLGDGVALAQLPKSKADLSEVYKRHPEIMKGFQYDFIVPIDSLFLVDVYDTTYMAKENVAIWNHEKEKQAILEELESKGRTLTYPMYREYVKGEVFEKLIEFKDGKFLINQPVFDDVSKEMKALRELSGDIDEQGLFSQDDGNRESFIGTPKARLVNGLNIRDIFTNTLQIKGSLEKPSENKYPNVFGIYVRKNTKLTDSFIDYMLSEEVTLQRLDWSEYVKGRITALTDEQIKESIAYYGMDGSYFGGYKAIQDYVNGMTPPTREEMAVFDMLYKIKKQMFLTCEDETGFEDFENNLVKDLDAISSKMKMVR